MTTNDARRIRNMFRDLQAHVRRLNTRETKEYFSAHSENAEIANIALIELNNLVIALWVELHGPIEPFDG